MNGRPLYWAPAWLLTWAQEHPGLRGLWAEAWLEMHERSVEAARDAANETGAHLVSPPRGVH